VNTHGPFDKQGPKFSVEGQRVGLKLRAIDRQLTGTNIPPSALQDLPLLYCRITSSPFMISCPVDACPWEYPSFWHTAVPAGHGELDKELQTEML